jgi:hypothetical protein
MLGRLRMTVDECIDAYVSMSDKIFQNKRRYTLKERFDSKVLELVIQDVIKGRGLEEDALLKDEKEDEKDKDKKCRV